eukprot:scaffold109323_cov31-Tisochrysis_lutea.AAC.1
MKNNKQQADTDAIYEISFSQAGDLVLHDTTVYAAIVELSLELEGVDPEPDFWARSSEGATSGLVVFSASAPHVHKKREPRVAPSQRGPWHIAVNEDCMQQFQARYRYGLQTITRVYQVDVAVKIGIESIEDKLNKKSTSTRKALYEALQDVAAHFVVEADGLAQASKITLSILVKAVEKEGLTFLKGNRERMQTG